MFAWTAAAWAVDAGLLFWVFTAVQKKLQMQAGSPEPWHGTTSLIVIMALIAVSIVVSIVLVAISDARWVRLSALVAAAVVPGTGIAVMAMMMLGAMVVAITGGRFN